MKNIVLFFWETIKVVVVALLIVIPIRYFLFQPFIVSGSSMEPNFSHGDYLIVESLSYKLREPQRGEVVVFHYPEDPTFRHIKRIVGLPEETIIINDNKIEINSSEGESFYINEENYLDSLTESEKEEFYLKEDEYFVMGDNRSASLDSRRWGSLPKENIIGRTVVKVFPFSEFELVSVPDYY